MRAYIDRNDDFFGGKGRGKGSCLGNCGEWTYMEMLPALDGSCRSRTGLINEVSRIAA